MASKKIDKKAKFQCIGGVAKPGAELASLGINMQKFCQEFNARTKERVNEVVPVVMTIFLDKSFKFILKTSPVSYLLKSKLQIKKGSAKPNSEKNGKISRATLEEIAKHKMADLNTNNLEQAIRIIMGTVKSMGIEVETPQPPKKEPVTEEE